MMNGKLVLRFTEWIFFNPFNKPDTTNLELTPMAQFDYTHFYGLVL